MDGPAADNLLAGFRSHERWMREALREAALAEAAGEVPVGAVVVRDGQLLSRGHNQVERMQDPTAHAEVIAIGAAGGGAETWRLDDAVLYVTLEPCIMCCGALLLSRIRTLVFGAHDPRAGAVVSTARLLQGNPYRHPVDVIGGILSEECAGLLQSFFQKRRA
jgi:tRNA(adenine34) deaminase